METAIAAGICFSCCFYGKAASRSLNLSPVKILIGDRTQLVTVSFFKKIVISIEVIL